ncbi:MAG TPA: CvpA family protein [Bacteroidia bacterium]|jgi:membrane protein required for colicin V production|nr:CvpA family protein [Bacteroidia bacterium]
MNFLDICIGAPLLWAIYKGFIKGFIMAIASLIGFWLGIWGSIHFSNYLVPIVKDKFEITSTYLPIAAFFVTFLLILLLIYLLARLLQKVAEGMELGIVNKLAGAVFNFFKYTLIISVFISILNGFEQKHELLPAKLKKESVLFNPIRKIAPAIIPSFKESFKSNFGTSPWLYHQDPFN